MNYFRDGLTKIVDRKVRGNVVMVMESAEWAVSSPSCVYAPIALGEDQGAEGTSNQIAADERTAGHQECTLAIARNNQNNP